MAEITFDEIEKFRQSLQPLIGVQFEILKIPREILVGFEPSQIGTIVGALMDACIPQLALIMPNDELMARVGLKKHAGILGDREGYPDFLHSSGVRAELKLLYVDPVGVTMKKPPTPREPSARVTQKVTVKNVEPDKDVLLVIAYQLQPNKSGQDLYSPGIIDLGIFPMIEVVGARDNRLKASGGKWFGNYDTPAVLSKQGLKKLGLGKPIIASTYGRKQGENKDYNEDTNFGKLSRIPYPPLQTFLTNYGYKVRTARKARIGQVELLIPEEVEIEFDASPDTEQGILFAEDSADTDNEA